MKYNFTWSVIEWYFGLMVRLFNLTLFSLCLAGSAYAKGDTSRVYDVRKRIFFEPLAVMDAYNAPPLRIGMEWPLPFRNCSVFGVWGQVAPLGDDAFINYDGVYVKAGFRKCFLDTAAAPNRLTYSFFSVHVFYKSQHYTKLDNIWVMGKSHPEPGASYSYDLNKTVTGIHAEAGTVQTRGHLSFKFFIGLGVRIATVTNSASDSMFLSLYHVKEGFVNAIGDAPKSNSLLPSMTLGVRLGYIFRRRMR